MAKKVTMDQIATSLNVSKSLVSRALNNRYGVNNETRFRILMEATRLGYISNEARTQKTSQIDSVTVIMLYAVTSGESYMSKVLEGIEKTLSSKNISCKLKFLEMDENNVDYQVPYWRLDTSGVIVLGYITDANLRSLYNTGYPTVLADVQNDTMLNFDKVMANNYYGGYIATQHLLEQGFKRFMYIGASDVGLGFSERFRGFRECLERQNDPAISYECLIDPSPGRQPVNIKQLSERLKKGDLPEALFCANDTVADWTIKLLKELDVKVPDEVSVMGFDNEGVCELFEPYISSIAIPTEEIGKKAVELLLRRIEQPNAPIEFIQLNPTIVERQSVKKKRESNIRRKE